MEIGQFAYDPRQDQGRAYHTLGSSRRRRNTLCINEDLCRRIGRSISMPAQDTKL
jgi:hypothetical protein